MIEIPNNDRYLCSPIIGLGANPCLDPVAANHQIIRTLWIFVLLRPCLASGSIGTVATRTDENRKKQSDHQAQDSMDGLHSLRRTFNVMPPRVCGAIEVKLPGYERLASMACSLLILHGINREVLGDRPSRSGRYAW